MIKTPNEQHLSSLRWATRKLRWAFGSAWKSSGDASSEKRASLAQPLEAIEENGQLLAESLRLKFRDTPPSGQDAQWKQDVQELANVIPPKYLTHHLLRRLEKHKIRVAEGVSFHRYMVEDSEIRKMKLRSLSWWLNRKTTAYRFVDALGVRRPKGDLEHSSLDKLTWRCPGVLKAVSSTGGRGTFLILANDEMVHVADNQRFSSRGELNLYARSLMDPDGRKPLRNRWVMEELILENREERKPARDFKFYCFYGEVLLVLEVIREDAKALYSFTQPDGSSLRPGDWDYTYFEGVGPTAGAVDLAARISAQIPHPFMRIDLLNGEEEPVFGEFTPRPGGFHAFDAEWDRRMGEAWARAEDRIQRDLLLGKRFDKFLSATGVFSSK